MSAPWVVLVVALWLVVIGETVLVLGLSRRLTALESPRTTHVGGATMGAMPIGTPIPREIADRLAIPSPDTAISASVILFLSPECGPCRTLADAVKAQTIGRDAGQDFEIVVVTNEAGVERFSHVGRTVLDPVGATARSLSVPGTPFGFGTDSQGIIRRIGLANTVDDVRQLAAAPSPASQPTVSADRLAARGLR